MKSSLAAWIVLCGFIRAIPLAHAEKPILMHKLDDVGPCLKSNEPNSCYAALEKYLRAHPADHLRAAQTLHRYFMPYLALEWFQGPIKKNKSVCLDPVLKNAFLEATGQDGKPYELAKRFLEKDCNAELLPVALDGLDRWSGPGYTALVCPAILKAGKTHANCAPKKETATAPAATGQPPEQKLPHIDRAKIAPVGALKIYSGPEQSTLSLLKISHDPSLYLIKFEGTDTPWDGMILLHREDPRGDTGESVFWTEHSGHRLETITKQQCNQGYCAYELNLPGMIGTKAFYFDDAKSKKGDATSLVRAFQR